MKIGLIGVDVALLLSMMALAHLIPDIPWNKHFRRMETVVMGLAQLVRVLAWDVLPNIKYQGDVTKKV